MLPKHPDTISDEDLQAWVKRLVDDVVEEGPRLDYKEIQALDKPSERREVAKDISSFANEVGGTVLYGIPEKRTVDGRPIPSKPYGITPLPNFESRVENVLVDSIRPTLPEWRIRSIVVSQRPKKVVYLAWVPESWVGVHMVEGYGDNRYYRRGQYRAVPMTERELHDRYERLSTRSGWLQAFLKSRELNYVADFLPSNFRSHYVLCPLVPLVDIDFSTGKMQEWLHSHPYPPHAFSASPYGARTDLIVNHEFQKWDPYMELYKNGAISCWRPTAARPLDQSHDVLAYVSELKYLLDFLRYAGEFYSFVAYSGPIRALVEISHTAIDKIAKLRFPVGFSTDSYPVLMSHDHVLRMSLEESAMTLTNQPRQVLKRLADEMYRAYGYFEANCFDDQLNVVSRR